MPSNAVALDLATFLDALSFNADDLTEARAAVRLSRSAWNAARAEAQKGAAGLEGRDALRRATALYLLGRIDQARRVLEKAGTEPQAALLRGRCALELGDPAAAANHFASLVGSPADGTNMMLDLATAAALAGDTPLAQKAASKLPEGPDQLYAEGIALESDGEYGEAKGKYEAALKQDPDHRHALFHLARRLDTEGIDDRAIELYRHLVSLQPTYVNALINLALLNEDQGRYAEAQRCYRRVLEADPNHVRARVGLKDVMASQTMYFDEDHERLEDRRAQVLRTPISEFELSVRSRNCLSKMNIETLGDLVHKSENELLAYKNFGETSLQEIKDILAQKGLRLGMTSDDEAPLYSTSRAEAEAQLDALFGSLPGGGTEGAPAAGLAGAPLESPGQPDPRTVPIDALDLSIRARRCMDNLGIETVGALLERSEQELLASKNFGQTSLNEVRRKLERMNLSLKKR
jgi:DNA-directed RNA polymerase subunit alpha